MTSPPHIEAAAKKLCLLHLMSLWKGQELPDDFEEAVESQINSQWPSHTKQATLVWSLARKATLEEAPKVAGEDKRTKLAKECGFNPPWHKHALAIAAAIRALSVEE